MRLHLYCTILTVPTGFLFVLLIEIFYLVMCSLLVGLVPVLICVWMFLAVCVLVCSYVCCLFPSHLSVHFVHFRPFIFIVVSPLLLRSTTDDHEFESNIETVESRLIAFEVGAETSQTS